MPQITIGPEFFRKSKLDYSNWVWAFVREIAQNSIDCRSSKIVLSAQLNAEGDTVVVVQNNGSPMTETEMVTRLLSLGSSGKNFEGTVGGFGKAKEILYFTHKSYKIESGTIVCEGSGANYEITLAGEYLHGTRSTVVMEGNVVDRILIAAKKFVQMSNVRVTFYINGEEQKEKLHCGRYRKSLSFGDLYTNKYLPNLLVVRVHGIPMFYRSVNHKGCVVVELSGDHSKILCSSRDGLVWSKQIELDRFVTELSVDRRTTLKSREVEYHHFEGTKFRVPLTEASNESFSTSQSSQEARPIQQAAYTSGVAVQEVENSSDNRGTCFDFVVKNETGYKIKPQYLPGEKFSPYAMRIARIWTNLLVELHKIFKCSEPFSVGFVFSEDLLGLFERGSFGRVFFINPVKIEGNKWVRKYKTTLQYGQSDLNSLAATALHEFVHGLGYLCHDEDFSNKLTQCMEKVLTHHSDIRKCFKI